MNASRPAIGIAFSSPIDERTWSGIPAGLTRGLEGCGARVTHLTAAATAASTAPSEEAAAAVSAEVAGALEAAGPLDGVVQMESTFSLPDGVPFVTFEDATVAQALAVLSLPPALAESWRRRQHDIYLGATGCCLASEWAARSVREDYGIPAEKVHVVGFGANLEVEPGPDSRFDTPRFLFLGRSWARKNGPAVLRAFAEVRRRLPTATLDLVGAHPEIGDSAGVTGHGPLDHSATSDREALATLFRRATCLVLPSRFEPFGIAYVEAGAACVPSIGTAVGGATDAIGAGGVIVDPGDEDALREAMLELCDPTTARRLGLAAREHAADYTWERVAERILAALRLR
jgi:glycogen synthase